MSKVDALRAMREAKYARMQANAGVKAQRPSMPVAPPATAAAPAAAGDTCGHKSMNGRACTREPGHEQKSHRYS
jgi:hypothetical protein